MTAPNLDPSGRESEVPQDLWGSRAGRRVGWTGSNSFNMNAAWVAITRRAVTRNHLYKDHSPGSVIILKGNFSTAPRCQWRLPDRTRGGVWPEGPRAHSGLDREGQGVAATTLGATLPSGTDAAPSGGPCTPGVWTCGFYGFYYFFRVVYSCYKGYPDSLL